MNRQLSKFKKLAGCALVGAAALLAAPAHAGVIGFESSLPAVYNHGEKFFEGGLTFTTNISKFLQSEFGINEGMAGMVLDSNNPDSCGFLIACPSGGAGNFYGGLNDGHIVVSRDGNLFSLASLRFGFIAPVTNLADGSYGQLVLNATLADGSTATRSRDFAGQDGSGNFMFGDWDLDEAFAGMALTSLEISACMFDGNGGCVAAAEYLSQFAIDDLEVELPLPGSAPMLLTGLAALALFRRRTAK